MTDKPIAILGAGAFGTSLALLCYRAGHKITLITKSQDQAKKVLASRINEMYLPGIRLPEDAEITDNMAVIKDAKALVLAIPAQEVPAIVNDLKKNLTAETPVIICCKGIIDKNPLPLFPSEFLKDTLPNPLAVLSGPNFAIEIAQNQPAAATLATPDFNLIHLFQGKMFRLYPSKDLIGVQLAGVVKNILAISCGLVSGKGFGANTTAAVITRGLAEMTRLGIALGADMATFLGLAGVGDLTLTCSSQKSRNYRLGFQLGQGAKIDSLIGVGQPLAEGYYSAGPILKLAKHYQVEMPLCEAVYAVLLGSNIDSVIDDVLSRPIRTDDFLASPQDEMNHSLAAHALAA